MKSIVLFLLSLMLGSGPAWSAPSADEILAATDVIRNPGKPFSVRTFAQRGQ